MYAWSKFANILCDLEKKNLCLPYFSINSPSGNAGITEWLPFASCCYWTRSKTGLIIINQINSCYVISFHARLLRNHSLGKLKQNWKIRLPKRWYLINIDTVWLDPYINSEGGRNGIAQAEFSVAELLPRFSSGRKKTKGHFLFFTGSLIVKRFVAGSRQKDTLGRFFSKASINAKRWRNSPNAHPNSTT